MAAMSAAFFILATISLSACGSTKDLSGANDVVTRFHAQLDGQDFGTIYSQADQRFRDSISQPKFIDFMNAIHTKLGNVTDASRQGFFVNYNTSGTQVRLTYTTKFSAGSGQEEFVLGQERRRVCPSRLPHQLDGADYKIEGLEAFL
jgi:hypothetical protein